MGFGGGARRILSVLGAVVVLTIAVAVMLAPAPAGPAAAVLDAEEQEFLALINEYRVANGVGHLSLNRQLDAAARWMSRDMAAKNYVSHTDSMGRGSVQRMAAFGYGYNTWAGENIAAGIYTAQAAFELWKDSPGHNASMLNANLKVIGIARAYGEGTTHGWYWTTDFGGRADPLSATEALAPEPALKPTPEPPPAPPPEPAPQVASEQRLAPAPAGPAGAVLDAEEREVLALINEYRAANGLAPLSLNGKLNEAARWMSRDMAAKNYASHTDSLGRDPFQRMASFGYTYNTWMGENIVAGADTAQAAFELWKDSPGHNASMLNANYKVIGIARAYGEGTTHGWYWTTDFGGRADPLPATEALAPEPAREPTPEPPPAPPPEPSPQVASEQRLEPAQEPGPDSTPKPAPQPLGWREITSMVGPLWERLTLLDADGSLLRAVSYIADRYLALRTGVFDPRTTSDSQPTYTKD